MSQNVRRGLRLRCESGIHDDVRSAAMIFCKWLRFEYEFPIRVVIYLKKAEKIKNSTTKELVTATFFDPFDKNVEPYIRVATGYYLDLITEEGKLNALYPVLESIAHELSHYFQWFDDLDLSEEQAEEMAEGMLDDFQCSPLFNEIFLS
ncbi:hypothetical protein [Sporolactobacillus pectinivorans]|uniref:hypothetical protein n=1 Tax=Sporolactobacillus pectinivorans TaxID=1591408 RepID=UPI001EFD2A9D|nr:hypothetical protein [Sporolactobacillus pectinivorans]